MTSMLAGAIKSARGDVDLRTNRALVRECPLLADEIVGAVLILLVEVVAEAVGRDQLGLGHVELLLDEDLPASGLLSARERRAHPLVLDIEEPF